MRAWGRGVTGWARTAQKSGSRLLPNAAIGVWLWKVFKERAMLTGKFGQSEAPWCVVRRGTAAEVHVDGMYGHGRPSGS